MTSSPEHKNVEATATILEKATSTPVMDFGHYYAKREDLACATNLEIYPSGSKVRQYTAMAVVTPSLPMVVGCSADSAMQIYVAAAAEAHGVEGIVYTAERAVPTDATRYAVARGAKVIHVRPGYLSVIRARAREYAMSLPSGCVRWDPRRAVEDTALQCGNIPDSVRRIVVATGSGLTAAGVLVGLARAGRWNPVVAVAVSDMATVERIMAAAQKVVDGRLPHVRIIRVPQPYGRWVAAKLPDGTVLDPYYAAKVLPYVEKGDLFWIPGLRPLAAMPAECRRELDRSK